MAKPKTSFVCESCGSHFSSWAGRCAVCGEWNTIVEEAVEPTISTGRGGSVSDASPAELTEIGNISIAKHQRLQSGLPEFDRVLGGDDPGLVPGSILLLAGTPGVGKSTLLLQLAATVPNSLYFSAEESLEQIHLRSTRLGLNKSKLRLSAERNVNKIIAAVKDAKPSLVVIDSIQTVYDDALPGAPGSLTQVRDNGWRLQQLAKLTGVTILIVGHVTKEGLMAGPRVLEHLVDVVLYLEGERRTGLRVLRGEKNRFGSTEEVGIWQLGQDGFEAVEDPGRIFAGLITEDVPGRALTMTVEGSRAFVVEIQALVTKTAFGYPKRAAQGIDVNRLTLLLAVLENRLGAAFSNYDVYVNVVGGFTLKDPGVDVAVAAAAVSGLNKKTLPAKLVIFGEVGLLGEVRPAFGAERRAKEAKRLGYTVTTKFDSIKDLPKLFSIK